VIGAAQQRVARGAAVLALLLVAGCGSTSASTAGALSGPSPPVAGLTGGWRVVASPAGGTPLYGIACVAAANCWAVGGAAEGTAGVEIEHDVNGTWTLAGGGQTGQLNGITCLDTGVCWAVGEGPYGPLIETSAGDAWRTVPAPDAGSDYWLDDIACPAPGDCWAVGGGPETLIEHYSGGVWDRLPRPGRLLGGGRHCDRALHGYRLDAGHLPRRRFRWQPRERRLRRHL
jgi:hypothetical protein